MTDDKKQEIATNFPRVFEHASLGVSISPSEFSIFEQGIFAGSMDEKWNVFVLDSLLYFARSWTNYCIYKINVEKTDDQVLLTGVQINRDERQYRSINIHHDIVNLKKLIQSYLNRDDLYSDPKLELPLIKQTINSGNYQNFIKSIGSNNVGITRTVHQTLTSPPNTDFFDVIGWDHLKKNIANRRDDEPLISLYIQHSQDQSAKTFYFDIEAQELLGEITISKKND